MWLQNNEFYCCSFSEKKEKGNNEKINQIGLIKSQMIDFELQRKSVQK